MSYKKKSAPKQAAEGTQEFFSKAVKKDANFTFSSAPLNKDKAKEQHREARADPPPSKKRSTFLNKLYRDDDDLQELKVLAGGDDAIDSDFEGKEEPGMFDTEDKPKKREQKSKKKAEDKSFMGSEVPSTKIARLVSEFVII